MATVKLVFAHGWFDTLKVDPASGWVDYDAPETSCWQGVVKPRLCSLDPFFFKLANSLAAISHFVGYSRNHWHSSRRVRVRKYQYLV